jgi:hypothetical protein
MSIIDEYETMVDRFRVTMDEWAQYPGQDGRDIDICVYYEDLLIVKWSGYFTQTIKPLSEMHNERLTAMTKIPENLQRLRDSLEHRLSIVRRAECEYSA